MTRHLLVDGYNVLHRWDAGLRCMKAGQLAAARDLLIERVRVIHDTDGIRTTLVFDGKGNHPEIEEVGRHTAISILYSPAGCSADSLIEQIVLGSKHPSDVMVVSEDSLIRQTVQAAGASTLHPDDLQRWVERCLEQQRMRMDNLKHKQPPEKLNQLDNWPKGLAGGTGKGSSKNL